MSTPRKNRPWYYVPGRPDRSAQLISERREKQARRQQEWSAASNYFARCDAQVKLYHQWEENERRASQNNNSSSASLAAHTPSKQHLPPYDVDEREFEAKASGGPKALADRQQQANEIEENVKQMVRDVKRCETRKHQLTVEEQKLLGCVRTLLAIRQEYDAQRNSWQLKLNKFNYIRFARDKLRNKVFVILQQLHFAKTQLQALSNEFDTFLTSAERAQLVSCIETARQFFDILIGSNTKRNADLTCLFHEEAVELESELEERWKNEEALQNQMFDGLFETIKMTAAEKLKSNIIRQEALLVDHEAKVRTLLDYLAPLKNTQHWTNLNEVEFAAVK